MPSAQRKVSILAPGYPGFPNVPLSERRPPTVKGRKLLPRTETPHKLIFSCRSATVRGISEATSMHGSRRNAILAAQSPDRRWYLWVRRQHSQTVSPLASKASLSPSGQNSGQCWKKEFGPSRLTKSLCWDVITLGPETISLTCRPYTQGVEASCLRLPYHWYGGMWRSFTREYLPGSLGPVQTMILAILRRD